MNFDELSSRVHSTFISEPSSESSCEDNSDLDEEYRNNQPAPEILETNSVVTCEPFELVKSRKHRKPKVPKLVVNNVPKNVKRRHFRNRNRRRKNSRIVHADANLPATAGNQSYSTNMPQHDVKIKTANCRKAFEFNNFNGLTNITQSPRMYDASQNLFAGRLTDGYYAPEELLNSSRNDIDNQYSMNQNGMSSQKHVNQTVKNNTGAQGGSIRDRLRCEKWRKAKAIQNSLSVDKSTPKSSSESTNVNQTVKNNTGAQGRSIRDRRRCEKWRKAKAIQNSLSVDKSTAKSSSKSTNVTHMHCTNSSQNGKTNLDVIYKNVQNNSNKNKANLQVKTNLQESSLQQKHQAVINNNFKVQTNEKITNNHSSRGKRNQQRNEHKKGTQQVTQGNNGNLPLENRQIVQAQPNDFFSFMKQSTSTKNVTNYFPENESAPSTSKKQTQDKKDKIDIQPLMKISDISFHKEPPKSYANVTSSIPSLLDINPFATKKKTKCARAIQAGCPFKQLRSVETQTDDFTEMLHGLSGMTSPLNYNMDSVNMFFYEFMRQNAHLFNTEC